MASSLPEPESTLKDKPTTSSNNESMCNMNQSKSKEDVNTIEPDKYRNRRVELYTEDKGPKWYNVVSNIVTPPIISKNLPEAFKFMPVHGVPKKGTDLDDFYKTKVREFVGCDLGDDEFNKLASYCR